MLVVVGGHSRNIGKTSVAAGIIRAMPELNWTAVKITQHGHGICSAEGEPCGCTTVFEHPFALTAEEAAGPSDTGRFLAAGASRSYWLRTPVGGLGHGMGALRDILESAGNSILESNSVLQFLTPDLYLVVLDYSVPDMKDSARRYLDRAGAFVVANRDGRDVPWAVPHRWIEAKPCFPVVPPEYFNEELKQFIARRLAAVRQ